MTLSGWQGSPLTRSKPPGWRRSSWMPWKRARWALPVRCLEWAFAWHFSFRATFTNPSKERTAENELKAMTPYLLTFSSLDDKEHHLCGLDQYNGCGYSGPDKLQDGCWGESASRVIEQAYWSVRLLYSPAKRFLRSVPCIWCTHSHLIITLLSWHWQTVQLKTLISSFRRVTFSKQFSPRRTRSARVNELWFVLLHRRHWKRSRGLVSV